MHIDFAFPQSNNSDIDNFEIRIEAKQSFSLQLVHKHGLVVEQDND